jgi:HD-GYP domain-containing protein (c-di-GMP phosphodiesterase class II)
MEEVSLKEFKQGNVVNQHIYFSENFIVFSKYLVLTEKDIERARRFNLDKLLYESSAIPPFADDASSKDDIVGEASEEDVKEMDTASFEKEKEREGAQIQVEEEVQKKPAEAGVGQHPVTGKVTIYGSAVALMNKEFLTISLGQRLDIKRIYKIASIILSYVSNVREEALIHVSRGRDKYRLEVHSVNACILAALICYHLKTRGRDLINIVSGALLHDIGILFVKERDNIDRVKEHTILGFQYLKSIKNTDPFLVMPALQHHEKAFGNGYPHKIKLNDMEFSSKVTTVCDFFDNQISLLKYGKDISIHFTKDEFLELKKEDFDQNIFLASLTSLSSIFKPESVVLLNDGRLALIKKTSARFPLNPVIEVIADAKGNKIHTPEMIDLIRKKDVWITRFVKRPA